MGVQLQVGKTSHAETCSASFASVFADLRAIARLLQMRASQLDGDDAEEIGFLAQLVQNHAERGLARIEPQKADVSAKNGSAKVAARRR